MDLSSYLDNVHPKGGLVEQVIGFSHPFFANADKLQEVVPLTLLLQKLRARSYVAQALRLNNDIWVDVPRERHRVFHNAETCTAQAYVAPAVTCAARVTPDV